jgi:hypothetical protein
MQRIFFPMKYISFSHPNGQATWLREARNDAVKQCSQLAGA